MTLTEFLLARIAEDEDEARYPTVSEWVSNMPTVHIPVRRHVSRWNPARVLAECEAKRKIIERLNEETSQHYAPFEREWEWCPAARPEPLGDLPGGPGAPCECSASWPDYKRAPLLRLLALPCVDNPDYQQEWRPEEMSVLDERVQP